MDEIGNIGGAREPEKVQGPVKTKKVVRNVPRHETKSSIARSEKEEHPKEPLAAGAPVLPPPLTTASDIGSFIALAGLAVAQATIGLRKTQHDIDESLINIQLQMSKVASDIMSKWAQSEQDLAAQNTKFQAKKRTHDIQTERTNENEAASEENGEKARAVSEQALAVSGLLLAGLVPGIAIVSPNAMVPVTQAIAALVPPGVQAAGATALPVAFFSLAGALTSGAVLRASVQTFLSGAKEKKPINSEFVKQYAARILSTINDPEFNSTLSKLFPDKKDLIPLAKLVLLATALGLSYKAETGHMIGLDFLGLINGQIILSPKDPRRDLVVAFQITLSGMKNPELLKQRLKNYFDSNPSLDHLLEPAEALAGLYSDHEVLPPLIGG